ncbi:MAG: SGNH/GDSL hydrolase family protein [Elusimicrobia bacterium]|nr:SGNH/GDSL hydrolase family protein [Elusimicrobiota bacterium]
MRQRAIKRVGGPVLYGAYLLLVLFLVDGACYLRYRWPGDRAMTRRPSARAVRGVPPATLRRLGWLEADHESSFVNFGRAKRRGVIRVGCVGDSFTAGAEAGFSEDFPTILQRLFRERGYANVEVLNFGSGGYGFQQGYILWEEVGRHFDLDYIVLGPEGFFPERDTTFGSFSKKSPSADTLYHARWILDGPGLRLVEVVGDTFEDRAAAYRCFVPYWRYLRYDLRAPAFLSCLLPQGRELRNPFYYQRDPEKEAFTIYERLFNAMADSGAQVVVGHYDQAIVELGKKLRRRNLFATRLEEARRFPYRAVKNHDAPAGNRLLAEQFFAILTGRREAVLPEIGFEPLERAVARPDRAPSRNLDDYERVGVGLEGGKPWRFVEIMRGTNIRDVPAKYFRASGLRSLLILKLPNHLLPQAVFYPVGTSLEEAMPLTVRPARGAAAGKEFLLGRVSLLRQDLDVGVVDLGEVLQNAYPGFNNEDTVQLVREPFRRFFPGTILLGTQALFQASAPDEAGRVTFHPLLRRFLQIYAPAELLGGAAASGRLSLRLETGRGPRVVLPLGRWRRAREDVSVAFEAPNGLKPIPRSGARGRKGS